MLAAGRLAHHVLCALCGLVLTLALPPTGWWPLVFVLAPLVVVARAEQPRRLSGWFLVRPAVLRRVRAVVARSFAELLGRVLVRLPVMVAAGAVLGPDLLGRLVWLGAAAARRVAAYY